MTANAKSQGHSAPVAPIPEEAQAVGACLDRKNTVKITGTFSLVQRNVMPRLRKNARSRASAATRIRPQQKNAQQQQKLNANQTGTHGLERERA
jgi:hypothetical protein